MNAGHEATPVGHASSATSRRSDDLVGQAGGATNRVEQQEPGWQLGGDLARRISSTPRSHNRREVYAVMTEDGSRKFQQGRAIYVRLLTQTLGAHLDDAALNELATITGTLLKALT